MGMSGEEQTGIDWHADGPGYSKRLGPMEDFVTAFVALTPSTFESGCLEYRPECGGTQTLYLQLQPGDFSLHSSTVLHHAIRNQTERSRVCVVLRFISGRVRDLI